MSDTPNDPATVRSSHGAYVPDHREFVRARDTWRSALAADSELRQDAVGLQLRAEEHRYTYTWEWAGVPIIRLPEDIVVLQEIVWSYRPERIVETGVARGGSVLLSASLMRLAGLEPAVLGIDHKLYPHTSEALTVHPLARGIELREADSTSADAGDAVSSFLGSAQSALLILDSNHTHEHVLGELTLLAPLFPMGSLVLVADTLIEEFPVGYYEGRPWDRGNNPLTAVNQFLADHPDFSRAEEWGRRALSTEFRDGILRRGRRAP